MVEPLGKWEDDSEASGESVTDPFNIEQLSRESSLAPFPGTWVMTVAVNLNFHTWQGALHCLFRLDSAR